MKDGVTPPRHRAEPTTLTSGFDMIMNRRKWKNNEMFARQKCVEASNIDNDEEFS